MPTVRGMTDAAAKRLKAPTKGQVDYFDPDFPGLVLRVSYGGRKVWTYNFRFQGQKRRMTLDVYPVMSVAQAHDAWRKARDMVRAGNDPSRRQTSEVFLRSGWRAIRKGGGIVPQGLSVTASNARCCRNGPIEVSLKLDAAM